MKAELAVIKVLSTILTGEEIRTLAVADQKVADIIQKICLEMLHTRSELKGREEWIASALRDYNKMKEWLNERGITEWEDTVSEVIKQCEV